MKIVRQRPVVLLLSLGFALPGLLAASTPVEPPPGAERDVLLVYFAALVGSRDPQKVPVEGVYLSPSQLAETIAVWDPRSDDEEIKGLLQLGALGEVLRQIAPLPDTGGGLAATFSFGKATHDLEMQIQPSPRDPTFVVARLQLYRAGELIFAPSLGAKLGERQTLTTRMDGPDGPFIFCVFEVHRVPEARLRELGVTRAWRELSRADPQKLADAPKKVSGADPEYTDEARAARVQGVVILKVRIDAEGRPGEISVLKGLPMGLTERAVEAVRGWRFTPPVVGGQPAAVEANVSVNFRLDE